MRVRSVFLVLAVALLVACSAGDEMPSAPTPAAESSPSPGPSPPLGAAPAPTPSLLLGQIAASRVARLNLLGRPQPRGVVRCGIDRLGADRDRQYVWRRCVDLSTGDAAEVLSGGGGPAVLTTEGRGSNERLVSLQLPQQATYDEDLVRMFPQDVVDVVDVVDARDVEPRPSEQQLLLATRRLPAGVRACRAPDLDWSSTSWGGPAMGTWYVPVSVTTNGPTCVLSSGELMVRVGRNRQLADLDLRDRKGGVLVLRPGVELGLHVLAPVRSA